MMYTTCHPNCEKHGKSPCEGIDCNGRERSLGYLSRTEVAERIGVTPGALSRYKLPEPDAWIGAVRGWLPATVDAWQAARPGRGARTDLHSSH